MITEIEDYFAKGCGRCDRFATPDCSARLWSEGLARLRRLCRDAGLQETVKWGHPCYTRAGRNVAIIGAFRGDFRLSFFDAALLQDPDGLLERQGPNTRHPDAVRFHSAEDVEAKATAIAGLRAPKAEHGLDLPEDLVEALAADPDLSRAFDALTPGRQRSHVIALSSAKASATRIARIDKLRPRILAGKGATEL